MFLIVHKINIIMLARIGERSHFNPEGQGSFTHTFGDLHLYSIVTPRKKKRTVAAGCIELRNKPFENFSVNRI